MADLPPNIGFDDEPVILLNYITLEDTAPSSSRPLIMSKSRNRVKSDSSLVSSSGTAGKKRSNKSSVSSLSDGSSFDPNESDKMNTPHHSTQSQESDVSPFHVVQSRSSPLKRLQEEGGGRNYLKSLDEADCHDSDKERGRKRRGFSVVVEPKNPSSPDSLSLLLIERDKEISDLRRQLKELQTTTHQSSDVHVPLISVSHVPVHQRCISETSEPPFILAEPSQRSTLQRLLEEQQVSYRLKTDNSDLRSKVLILEGEVDNLRQQNLVQLQQLEQATTSLAAASNSTHSPPSASPQKSKKKSIFGFKRSSGRKQNMGHKNGSGSSIDQSPRLKRPGFQSASNLSLEGSLSEHDISSLLTRKSEGRTEELNPLGGANFDFERLQLTLKLTMEEKSELGRQLELLREELRHQEEKREVLLKETINKEEASVKLQETIQALQLTTREKELLESEGEGLKYELETLRSERDSLTASLKGKEVKAVLKEKQEMDFLRSENKALMSEVRTLISNSDGLETSLSQLKREMVARDVRGHELKLKIKKLEKENAELKVMVSSFKESKDNDKSKENKATHNVLSTRRHNSPEKHTLTSSSSFSDQQSPSTGQPAMKPYHKKPSPFLTASTGESQFSGHERTQSEDLTSSVASIPPLQMVRTSSGGTKFVAVQVTLPTKENAMKVKDKSLSVPLLEEPPPDNKMKRKNSDSTLGTFVSVTSSGGNGGNGKPGVNSLVKMFESGKGEGERGGRVSLVSGALMESSLEESIEEKENERGTENRSDSVSSTKPSLKKTRKLSSSNSLKEEQERAKKLEEEETKQAKKREEERRKREIEAKEKQRKEEEEEVRERQKREQEERERREEQLRKEQEKQRKELEVKEKERREREKREKEERERKERERKERERKERERKEREKKERERKERERKEKEAFEQKERERKEEEERQRKEKERKEKERKEKEEQQRKRDEITADRSQTWPPKAENVPTTSTNTLPSSSSHRTDPKSPVSPVNSSPLINKPKPPPTIMGVAGRSKTHSVLLAPTQTSDSSLTGVVANLRSSWEKKSQMGVAPTLPASHPRLSKAPSVPVSYPRMERTSSLNVPTPPSAHLAPPPFTKTGSGPAGTIISSPSNQTKTTLGLKRVAHVSSEATPTNPAHTQNGHVTLRSRSPIDRSSSTDAAGAGEVVLRSNASPRLNRPASLYVSSSTQSPPISFGTPTSEKRLSSLITKLQVKDTTPTSATPISSFVQNQSPILPPRNVGGANNKSGPPPMTRPHSFYAGSSPKPLQRAASLASPLDRRTKKNMLIRWCQIKTQEYHNVNISNFGESFSNGLAFCALLHHFVPEKIPYQTLDGVNQKKNFELAFSVAEDLGIPSLLDVDDMVEMDIPDWMSVMTYVSYIYNYFSKKEQQS